MLLRTISSIQDHACEGVVFYFGVATKFTSRWSRVVSLTRRLLGLKATACNFLARPSNEGVLGG